MSNRSLGLRDALHAYLLRTGVREPPLYRRLREETARDPPSITKGGIEVGNDTWIGYGAILRDGVRMGEGAVIGAGAVVMRAVEPGGIVAGNPARVIGVRS